MRLLHEQLLADGLYGTSAVIITAGGSAYFDDVVTVLSPCISTGAETGGRSVDLMIRSGAYIIHDDGFYRGISPFSRAEANSRSGRHARLGPGCLAARARPGHPRRRQAGPPFDEGLPEPQLIGRPSAAPWSPWSAPKSPRSTTSTAS